MNIFNIIESIFKCCNERKHNSKDKKYGIYGCTCVKIITKEGNNILCRNNYCDKCLNDSNNLNDMWVPL